MTTVHERNGVHVLNLGEGTNTMREDIADGLEAVLDDIHTDDDATALVITATGKTFSQGYDLDHLAGLARTSDGAGGAFVQRSIDLLARILIAPVPTAAAVNGHAFGYGALLTLACDLRVQREDRGWICLPEVNLGLRFQPLQLALARAKLPPTTAEESILSGRRWDGPSALAAGIVHACAPHGGEVDKAIELLQGRIGQNRLILQGMKRDLFADVVAAQHEKVAPWRSSDVGRPG